MIFIPLKDTDSGQTSNIIVPMFAKTVAKLLCKLAQF